VGTPADLADWWDKQHSGYKKLLDEFVDENPQWWGVGVATLGATASDLGAGLVDTLRLGQGAAEGGWGYGKDALRLIGLAGPVGRVVRVVPRVGGAAIARLAKLDAAPNSGICSWVAATHALNRTGARLFATVDDLAKAVGFQGPAASLEATWAQNLVGALQKLGARVKTLHPPRTLQEVERATKATDGVVLFSIKWTMASGGQAQHTVYAFKNALGQVRYSDRVGHVFSKIDDFAKVFPGASNFELYTAGQLGKMVVVEGVRPLFVGSGMAVLGLPVAKMAVPNPKEVGPETLIDAFNAKKVTAAGQKPKLSRRASAPGKALPPVEHLTGVQARLNNLGFAAGPVDGIDGPRTKRAVRRFQKVFELLVDGIPGPRTQAALAEAHGS